MSVKGREDSNCYPKVKLESREGPSGRVTQLVNDGAGVRIRDFWVLCGSFLSQHLSGSCRAQVLLTTLLSPEL